MIVVTEKIDGTNGQIYIEDDGVTMHIGSRNRWLTAEQDNHGFFVWVTEHREELLCLGPGRHFGEWWGHGIQRGYGLTEKRFSLFNVKRWHKEEPPSCCRVVPILSTGLLDDVYTVEDCMRELRTEGSIAAPGFMRPEGIVIYHTHSGTLFKKTLENDELGKTGIKELWEPV
jgi:hypothetical protein